MKIKSEGKRGTRSIILCANCGCEFSELNIRIRKGGGKFCCNDCYKEYRKKNKKDEKEANKLYQKKNKYGITKEEYYNLFKSQENKCLICGCEFQGKIKGFVDHNHNTGLVRGILCQKCNSLLGMANEDPKILENAIKYLQRYNNTVAE